MFVYMFAFAVSPIGVCRSKAPGGHLTLLFVLQLHRRIQVSGHIRLCVDASSPSFLWLQARSEPGGLQELPDAPHHQGLHDPRRRFYEGSKISLSQTEKALKCKAIEVSEPVMWLTIVNVLRVFVQNVTIYVSLTPECSVREVCLKPGSQKNLNHINRLDVMGAWAMIVMT
jgi:hypothetical protein